MSSSTERRASYDYTKGVKAEVIPPSGVGSPVYKDGNHSRFAPGSLLEKYEQSLQDPHLLSMRREIALLKARWEKLVESIEEDADTTTWLKFIELWVEFRYAIQSGDVKGQNTMLGKINRFVDRVETKINTWKDVEETTRLLARVTEAENRRLQAVQNQYTSEQVLYLLTTSIMTLKEIVVKYADPHAARHIIAEAAAYHRQLITEDPVTPDD